MQLLQAFLLIFISASFYLGLRFIKFGCSSFRLSCCSAVD